MQFTGCSYWTCTLRKYLAQGRGSRLYLVTQFSEEERFGGIKEPFVGQPIGRTSYDTGLSAYTK